MIVYTAECSKLLDGRTRHTFTKVDGEFTCSNCGQASDPARRWEPTNNAATRSAAPPDRRVSGLPSPGDHASLPDTECARHRGDSPAIRTAVQTD